MPAFAFVCIDKPGHLDLRQATREAHLAYVAETGVVVQGGPLLDEDGDMTGSLIVIDVPDIEAARQFGANDPYFKAGLFDQVIMRRWKKVVG